MFARNRIAMAVLGSVMFRNTHNEHHAEGNQQHHGEHAGVHVETAVKPEDKDAALHASIKAKFDNTVDIKDFRYYFRKDDLGNKRPTVELKLPVPSVEGLVKILEEGNEKAIALVMDALSSVIDDQARSLVADKEDINQDNFPFEQITWEYIANLPKAERRGGGISKETWEEFGKDYATTMLAATGKTADQVGLAVKLLLGKFNAVKTNKPILKALQAQLGLYATTSANAETYVACIEFLNNKATNLLEADEAALLELL